MSLQQQEEFFETKFQEIWNDITSESKISTRQKPLGYVLGGQPGAGKSNLIANIAKQCNNDIVIISADNYRKYHPEYEQLQKIDNTLSVKSTANFAGKMAENILYTALICHYNIVIEGTFRTSETPITTLKLMKNYGYTTCVQIQTCNKDLSWNSCKERYKKMKIVNPKEARITTKESHDIVVQNLSENILKVIQSGLADNLKIYSRSVGLNKKMPIQTKIFDSGDKEEFKKELVNDVLERKSKIKDIERER